MRKVALCCGFAAVACWGAPARAADFFVAPDGNDSNPGTLVQPFGTVERAQTAASPGDTVYIRGGVYRFSGTQATVGVSLTKSGQDGKPIRYFAYEAEVPIFDLFELRPQARVTGLDVRCNWIHLRGLEVRGVRQLIVGDSWGVRIRGDHNLIERLHVHDNEAPGIFITSGKSNLILNCDSHHNYDPLEDGGNADGFGCHSNGGDNVMRGCRAWENSDDGFDFINAPGTCVAEESWAFRNGYIPDTNMAGANGAGFKSGGFGNPPNTPATGAPRHVVRKSVAFSNRAIGFYANYHPGGIDFFNNTAFDNPSNYDLRTATGMTSSHTLRNNIAATPGRAIVSLSGGTDTNNSWTLPVQVTPADFASMDKALASMQRRADGSLPDMGFLRLAAESDLIDRGEVVGLMFEGKAPDLGAYEWGEAAPEPGVGGTAGMPASMDGGVERAAGGGRSGVAGNLAGASGAGVGGAMQPSAAGGGSGSGGGAAAGTGVSAREETATPGADGCSCRVGPGARREFGWIELAGVMLALVWQRRARSRVDHFRSAARNVVTLTHLVFLTLREVADALRWGT